MRDFLIDTNIWEYWFNPKREPQHSNVLKCVGELKQQFENGKNPFRVWISSVTWGEIEFGYQWQKKKDGSLETQFRQFISDIAPIEFQIDKHVAREYGRIRAVLFEKFGPKDKKIDGRRPEQLIDPVTSLELGIQENDLWITAQAVTFNLTLVTNDKRMARIREVAGEELYIENWAAEKP